MRILLISDIHANYPALDSALEQEDFDKLICLGDIVGLCGFPLETVERLREVSDWVLAGNHDVAVLEYGEGHVNDPELAQYELNHTQEQLSQEQKDWVNSLGTYGELRDMNILLAHAKPYLEESAGYKMGNKGVPPGDVVQYASDLPEWVDYLFIGHTHEQHYLDCSKFGHDVTVVNPGSLGYNGEYAIVDLDSGEVQMNEIDYHKITAGPPKKIW